MVILEKYVKVLAYLLFFVFVILCFQNLFGEGSGNQAHINKLNRFLAKLVRSNQVNIFVSYGPRLTRNTTKKEQIECSIASFIFYVIFFFGGGEWRLWLMWILHFKEIQLLVLCASYRFIRLYNHSEYIP